MRRIKLIICVLSIALAVILHLSTVSSNGQGVQKKEVWRGKLKDGTEITANDLFKILAEHKKWREAEEFEIDDMYEFSDEELLEDDEHWISLEYADLRKANLSGADLSYESLRKVNLSGADLSGAKLSNVNLSGANLSSANLSGVNLSSRDFFRFRRIGETLSSADLSDADLSGANLSGVNLSRTDLSGAKLSGANLSGAILRKADLSGLDMSGAILRKADLSGTNLSGVNLSRVVLSGAKLSGTNLIRSNLSGVNLSRVDLSSAKLSGANLSGAILRKADLSGLDMSGAILRKADLSDADLSGATLYNVDFRDTDLSNVNIISANLKESFFDPMNIIGLNILGVKGFSSIKFENIDKIVNLRKVAKDAGFKSQERQLTAALRKKRFSVSDLRGRILENAFLDYPTDYGAKPWKCLLILVAFFFVFSYVYVWTLELNGRTGIWKVWSKERLRDIESETEEEREVQEKKDHPELLNGLSGPKVLGYAFYFSLLSAFHIGWRDLNVGSWIARMQPNEYTFKATGWIRFVSGLHSLISIYLLALWALTQFGRPFE